MADHSASGIMRQSVRTDINRFTRRGNSTVLRANSPPFDINLGSKPTSLTQPQPPFGRLSFLSVELLRQQFPPNNSLCTYCAHSVPNLPRNRTSGSQFTRTFNENAEYLIRLTGALLLESRVQGVFFEPCVRRFDTRFKGYPRTPAKPMQPRNIEQFARRTIGLRWIKCKRTGVSNCRHHHLCEFADRHVLAPSNVNNWLTV